MYILSNIDVETLAMPYVLRSKDKKIIALFREPTGDTVEELSSRDPEVLEFLMGNNPPGETPEHYLSYTDKGMVRVLEDLIGVLIEKNVLLPTDLPLDAQSKLTVRHRARKDLKKHSQLIIARKDIL